MPRPRLSFLETVLDGGRLVPNYLSSQDETWLERLLAEFSQFTGEKQRDFEEHVKGSLPFRAPKGKLRLAAQVLASLARSAPSPSVLPRAARARLFVAAASKRASRDHVLACVAREFGASVAELESSLFADLPGERRVPDLPLGMSARTLALDANAALVSALLRRAHWVRVRARGQGDLLVRDVQRLGLICRVTAADDDTFLDVSGPLALFHHTDLYARFFGSLPARAAMCDEFELEAGCALGPEKELTSVWVRSGDPIASSRDLPEAPSRVEARFLRDIARRTKDWTLCRGEPLMHPDGFVFLPTFQLVHRTEPHSKVCVHLERFWTREHVEHTLHSLRAEGFDRVLLCVCTSMGCGNDAPPEDPRVLAFSRHIDVKELLQRAAALTRGCASFAPRSPPQ